ncbi:hypothetical protein GCM10007147_45080 [Nocardiopsis kunsanensis]|uniref:Uncharacterized protein n=1 Tax=Nocardiopsis kunsanensis TaxID=141693 RepID=A0A918XKZ3_9ACTN|nr:hypothetical protein GCM10007147_45080 [Nocardiopsis kunsanensis]
MVRCRSGDDDEIDVPGSEFRIGQSCGCSMEGQVRRGFLSGGRSTFTDPGPFQDPIRIDAQVRGEIGVTYDTARQIGTRTQYTDVRL